MRHPSIEHCCVCSCPFPCNFGTVPRVKPAIDDRGQNTLDMRQSIFSGGPICEDCLEMINDRRLAQGKNKIEAPPGTYA